MACSSLYLFLNQHAEGHSDVQHILPVFAALQRIIQEEDVSQGPIVVQRLFLLLDSLEAKCQQDFSQGRYDEPALVSRALAVWMRGLIVDPAFGKTHPHLVAMLMQSIYRYSLLEKESEAKRGGGGSASPATGGGLSVPSAAVEDHSVSAPPHSGKPPRSPPQKTASNNNTSSPIKTLSPMNKTASRLRRMASAAKSTTIGSNPTTVAQKANDKLLQGDTATLWRRLYADLPTPPAHTCAALLPVLLAWQQETEAYKARVLAEKEAEARVPPTTGIRVVPLSGASDHIMSTHHSLASVHDDDGSLVLHRRPTTRMSPRDNGGGSSTRSSSPRSSTSSGGLDAGERVVRGTVHLVSPVVNTGVYKGNGVYTNNVAHTHAHTNNIAHTYEAFKAFKSQQTT